MADTTSDRAELYQGADANWYWRLKAGNGETIAEGEGYVDKRDALALLSSRFPEVPIIEIAPE